MLDHTKTFLSRETLAIVNAQAIEEMELFVTSAV